MINVLLYKYAKNIGDVINFLLSGVACVKQLF